MDGNCIALKQSERFRSDALGDEVGGEGQANRGKITETIGLQGIK